MNREGRRLEPPELLLRLPPEECDPEGTDFVDTDPERPPELPPEPPDPPEDPELPPEPPDPPEDPDLPPLRPPPPADVDAPTWPEDPELAFPALLLPLLLFDRLFACALLAEAAPIALIVAPVAPPTFASNAPPPMPPACDTMGATIRTREGAIRPASAIMSALMNAPVKSSPDPGRETFHNTTAYSKAHTGLKATAAIM
ncbi:MAG: hypothetical protein D8B53_05560 [Corynebacterium sp.]|nr:MAG: hypothetical protein D8B53_05560 [Corynebacterium sp.]